MRKFPLCKEELHIRGFFVISKIQEQIERYKGEELRLAFKI